MAELDDQPVVGVNIISSLLWESIKVRKVDQPFVGVNKSLEKYTILLWEPIKV